MEETPVFNEIVPNSQEPGYSAIYRQKGLKELVVTMDPKVRTVRDMLIRTKDKYGDKPGLGKPSLIQDKSSSV